MTNLEKLNGNQLAQLLNKLDLENREDDAIKVEAEMDFRYEPSFKSKLIETQELWLQKMTTDYGLTRDQAINYLYYNEKK